MLIESRRRAYLSAMQVVHWLPRAELPFAAPSRPELLLPQAPVEEVELEALAPAPAAAPVAPQARSIERPKIEIPRPASSVKPAAKQAETEAEPVVTRAAPVPPPRFALQLLRAGSCLVLVELATGQPFQSRDPSYLLLKDMLRAAGLPDAPQIIGEPIRWPLLVRGNMDQGPEAARDFVQGFIQARLEESPCTCLWLIGLPALRFAAQAEAPAYYQELQVEALGTAWALPGLELLMDEPQRKADVWQAMRQLMARWKNVE
ncbi:energy transducer TonB [Pseudomonas plecoglossicida]|uniref:energy transducer TonB n=1 Tax=Pseudomonas plecoglossicida TaxID=70775 RepID=UPI0015E371DC|nr:energy transducer TonB [Pseudomonas plecoglossicida]MBA1198589.1 energy transducer TonB [Pseudomonas plecoglossicida]